MFVSLFAEAAIYNFILRRAGTTAKYAANSLTK